MKREDVVEASEEEEEETKPTLPNMKPTLRPISVSNNVSPLTEEDSNLPPADETSQDTKLGFSALKLGRS